jgi:hypothetical protein
MKRPTTNYQPSSTNKKGPCLEAFKKFEIALASTRMTRLERMILPGQDTMVLLRKD